MTSSLTGLSRFLLDELGHREGIIRTNVRLVTAMHAEGADWRLDALDGEQQRKAAAAGNPVADSIASIDFEEPWALVDALTRDPRASVASIARSTGGNPATVRRHLGQLLGANVMQLRCNAAPQLAGWPIEATWMTRVAPADVARSVAALLELSQLRLCMTVTGDANLIFTTYSRSIADLALFEARIGKVLPTLQILDTYLHLRNHKRMGWLLHPDGRTTGEVIMPSASPRPWPAP